MGPKIYKLYSIKKVNDLLWPNKNYCIQHTDGFWYKDYNGVVQTGWKPGARDTFYAELKKSN